MKNLEANYREDEHYHSAKKRVKKIKGFYVHLVVYLFINIAIILMNRNALVVDNTINWPAFSTAIFWGIGLFAHWASVFGPNILGKTWEEKKIMELMEKEEKIKWK